MYSACLREMALRERAAGTALQVLLKSRSRMLGGEFQRHDNRPRSVRNRVSTRPVIVPFEARANVVRESDLVSRGIDVTSEDVDDPFFAVVHDRSSKHRSIPERFETISIILGGDGNSGYLERVRLRPLRGFGETSFARGGRACLFIGR